MRLLFQLLCSHGFWFKEVAESDRRGKGLCEGLLVNRRLRFNCQVLSCGWEGGGERNRMDLEIQMQ